MPSGADGEGAVLQGSRKGIRAHRARLAALEPARAIRGCGGMDRGPVLPLLAGSKGLKATRSGNSQEVATREGVKTPWCGPVP